MFSKILRGKDLSELESTLNEFLTDCKIEPEHVEPDQQKRKLKIYNVQQFVVGEVKRNAVSLHGQPVPEYSFCLLLICGYE